MPTRVEKVRQSITLSGKTAAKLRSLAKSRHVSANRVINDLIEAGLQAEAEKKKRFEELTARFRSATDPEEIERLGNQLGEMVFGD